MKREYPILEFDPSPRAMIEPSTLQRPADVPEHCLLCFFRDVLEHVCAEGAPVIGRMHWEDGDHPVYQLDVQGRPLAVMHPGIGAPMAAALLEEVIALGCRKFVACGSAGVLDRIATGHIIVPTAAVRDEGTSYHYLPPAREVAADAGAVAAIEAVLRERGREYRAATTWTTDAPYRETPAKVALRREEGCLAVEMEAAAFFAVARFRGVAFGQVLYAGDDLSGDEWDHRQWWRHSVREELFWLAAEACLRL